MEISLTEKRLYRDYTGHTFFRSYIIFCLSKYHRSCIVFPQSWATKPTPFDCIFLHLFNYQKHSLSLFPFKNKHNFTCKMLIYTNKKKKNVCPRFYDVNWTNTRISPKISMRIIQCSPACIWGTDFSFLFIKRDFS